MMVGARRVAEHPLPSWPVQYIASAGRTRQPPSLERSLAATLDPHRYGDPEDVPEDELLGPYVLSFSLDPATDNRAPVGRDLVLSLRDALPALAVSVADREFTVRHDFVLPVNEADIDIVMDYPAPFTRRPKMVRVGRRGETLYFHCGDFFSLWTPTEFLRPPDLSLTEEQRWEWHAERSKFRYVQHGKSRNGTRQFLCPQCAGNVIGAAQTRMGYYKTHRHPVGVPSLGPPFSRKFCCAGSISICAAERHQWQPDTWGTKKQQRFYRWGRSRIENTNGLVKEDGGMDPKACRAPGTRAHSMALLSLAVANNVTFAAVDPLGDPPPTDVPEAQPSLFCVTPALHSHGNGSGNFGHGPSPVKAALPKRAPPHST